jgi:hypothetical protein
LIGAGREEVPPLKAVRRSSDADEGNASDEGDTMSSENLILVSDKVSQRLRLARAWQGPNLSSRQFDEKTIAYCGTPWPGNRSCCFSGKLLFEQAEILETLAMTTPVQMPSNKTMLAQEVHTIMQVC